MIWHNMYVKKRRYERGSYISCVVRGASHAIESFEMYQHAPSTAGERPSKF